MDGFEVLETLKEDANLRAIPVLVLTNLGQKEDIERCLQLGTAGYIIKAHSLPHETIKQIKQILHAIV
jgi:CheY-like chemotaxis protein